MSGWHVPIMINVWTNTMVSLGYMIMKNCLPFWSTWVCPPLFSWVSCYSIFSFTCMCMFCRLLFVLLYFFFWPLLCLSFFKLRILITPLVSSNSSYTIMKKLTYSRKCCINLINSIDHENEVVVGWNILVEMYPPWSTCGPSMLMEKLTNRKSVT
jgi:hypothetical protein